MIPNTDSQITTSEIIDNQGRVVARVELLHPGPGLGFVGPHRRIPGGFLTQTGQVLCLPGLVASRQAGDQLLLAWRTAPGQVQLARWDGAALSLGRRVDASGVHLGGSWLSRWRGSDARVENRLDGAPVAVPMGGRRGVPWPQEAGLVWSDGRALLRQQGQQAPRVAGVLDGRIRGFVVGPGGAVIAWTRDTVHGLPPGNGPLQLAVEGPVEGVAFSPDGRQALVEEAHGVVLVDLATGEVADFREEAGVAGWGFVVDVSGRRLPFQQEPDEPAWLPGPGLVIDDLLHGPGGQAWELATGRVIAPALCSGADLAVPMGPAVLVVEAGRLALRLPDGAEALIHQLDEDDDALELLAAGTDDEPVAMLRSVQGIHHGGLQPDSWRHETLLLPDDGPLLAVTTDGGILAPSPEGDRLLTPAGRLRTSTAPPALAPQPPLPSPLAALGLPFDGHVRAPDGRLWAWQEDGLLLRLD